MDTFTKNAPVGAFAESTADQVVYTGDHGMGWTEYPDGWSSTNSGGAEGYQPSTVQSVHDGVLDFYLHSDSSGNPVGANPSPLPAGNRYQTYGAWSMCERIAPGSSSLADFHQAPLLWPQNDAEWQSAESDYPEGDLNSASWSAFAHNGGSGAQDEFDIQSVDSTFDPTQWHVYTQQWGPGFRSYYVDGQLVGTSTSQVWSSPERWQLQIEPSGINNGGSGHVYVNWVWIGTRGGSSSTTTSTTTPSTTATTTTTPSTTTTTTSTTTTTPSTTTTTPSTTTTTPTTTSDPAPANSARPTITGNAQQGSTLTASNGTWTGGPTSFAYQWQDCASGTCSNIQGATGQTRTLGSGDVGSTVDVVVTAANSGGSSSATSAPVGPVTSTSSSPGSIQHVVWIWMENHGYNNVIGSSSAPYINNTLVPTYGLATNYFATDHPSLPNYMEAVTGDPNVGGSSDSDNPPADVNNSDPSIFSQLPGGGSRSLEEGMTSNCMSGTTGEYVGHHNPMIFLVPTVSQSDCNGFDVPFGSTPDISAKFTFITPNLIDDMHDGTVSDGDNFLKSYVPQLLATPQYQAGNTVIFIVWDEDGSQDGLDQENNHVPAIVISPVTRGVKDNTSYTHYSLLRTTEELLGLPLLGNAASANSMVGHFGF